MLKHLLWLCMIPAILPAQSIRDTLRYPITKFTQPDQTLPFLMVEINGKEAYFLLDTGSGSSVLDMEQLKYYKITTSPLDNMGFRGVGGTTKRVSKVTNVNTIKINNKNYAVNLFASELRTVVDAIKTNIGVNIFGILGSDFFEYHNTVLDYRRNVVIFLDNTVPIRTSRRGK